MPDASVNIGGDASGALAAVAAAQGAIDSLHGKTVVIDIVQRGGAGGLAAMARDMGRVGDAAERAGRAGRGMGEHFDRAGRSARGMGDHVGRAGDHMGRMADEAGRTQNHLDAVNRIMSGGAPSSISRSSTGMRQLANEADRARGSIGEIGSGSGGMRAIEAGAAGAGRGFRSMGAAAQGTSAEVIGVYRNTRQAITAAGEAGSAFSTAGGHTSQMGSELARTGARAGEAGKELARVGGQSSELARQNRSLAGSFANNPMLKSFMGWMGSLDNAMGRAGSAVGGVGSALGNLGDAAMPSGRALQGVGLAGGVAALGMGALGAAVAGVGLAGVAEDFKHNSQLMHAGEQAVRGFNRQFSAMKGETSAAGMPAMAGVASSMKGVGHELAQIGAANIAPVLNDVSSLGNQATAAMQKLAPSIGPATQGLTSLAGAVIGAFGDSGPAVTSFANSITSHAPQIQAGLSSIIDVASGLGSMAVDALAAFGTVDSAVKSVIQPGGKPGGDAISGARGMEPSAHVAGGVDWGHFASLSVGGQPYDTGQSAAPGAGGGKAVAPGQFDPSKPFSGMLPDGKGGFTPGTGDVAAPKAARPAGPSPDASRFAGMTGGQILDQQKADIGLPPPGQPYPGGVGPRGAGQSVGAMPARIAPSLGMGSIAPLNDMMAAAAPQVAGGGAATGAAMVQHVQKAVQVAAPAASAGGASIGAAMNTGMAAGSNSTQTVIDTVTIKHSKRIIDLASAILGVHSPSTEFDYLGRMTWRGFGQGVERESAGTFGAMSGAMGGALTGAQDMASKNAPGYDGDPGVTVSVKKPATYDEYKQAQADQQAAADRKASWGTQQNMYKPGSEQWWGAHNNRAEQLQAGREDRQRQTISGGMTHDERRDQLLANRAAGRERALANLGVGGRAKPSGDASPFAADQASAASRRQGLNSVVNPFASLPGMLNKAGQNSTLGLTAGLTAHMPKVQAAGAAVAGAGHSGYKKKDRQSSPSAVWGEMAGNSVAGLAGGFASNAGTAVDAATALGAAVAGPMNDQSLQIGYTWSRNVVTGMQTSLKTANFQGGTPDVDNEQIRTALAGTGSLGGYGGASVWKAPSASFNGGGAVAALTAAIQQATSQPQPIQISLDGQPFRDLVAEGGNQLLEVLLNALVGANG